MYSHMRLSILNARSPENIEEMNRAVAESKKWAKNSRYDLLKANDKF